MQLQVFLLVTNSNIVSFNFAWFKFSNYSCKGGGSGEGGENNFYLVNILDILKLNYTTLLIVFFF